MPENHRNHPITTSPADQQIHHQDQATEPATDDRGMHPESAWAHLQKRGISRRRFLEFCTAMTVMIGLETSSTLSIAEALTTQPRPVVIWRNFQECTCCSESLLRSEKTPFSDIILNLISLDFHEVLQAAAGIDAERAAHQAMAANAGRYILAIEGSIPTGANGTYCCVGGRTALDILQEDVRGAKAVIAWGNCAAYGCVQSAKPNPTGAKGVGELVKDKPVINVPGCPPIAEVMAAVVIQIATGTFPKLDQQGRPVEFYGKTVHATCPRHDHYEEGRFVESFDDDGARQGYCLYKLGCKGPVTYNACSRLRWNGGTSFPIQSGHPCLGCAEKNCWDPADGQSLYAPVAMTSRSPKGGSSSGSKASSRKNWSPIRSHSS
ncbi:hydrogenase small subunit [Heliophilum fasciatum]|uniref:Hydrogenase small subunit n=1 Tax=Heliophilum fasciatum TaxID=35700 RepID=A0A4R2RN42_9FIRM|nr:hydrogenase small subunit [Heliophilum fasciatum]MCW2278384.1 hydrogenase small subunit [Heliophilum fasciatum]TCP63717.1 hydrogenase small subunit [Heliophilum fasciatum]